MVVVIVVIAVVVPHSNTITALLSCQELLDDPVLELGPLEKVAWNERNGMKRREVHSIPSAYDS